MRSGAWVRGDGHGAWGRERARQYTGMETENEPRVFAKAAGTPFARRWTIDI